MATDPNNSDEDNTQQQPANLIVPDYQSAQSVPPSTNEAADLIREKVARVYAEEPSAAAELQETQPPANQQSKHQKFMQQLSTSGKDLAAIQTEWHEYYLDLPNNEKHEVWQEFYASNSAITQPQSTPDIQATTAQALAQHKHEVVAAKSKRAKKAPRQTQKVRDARGPQDIQSAIRDKVSAGGTLKVKHHLQSLFFGLGMGTIVVVIFLFSFFNEVIIAPFIQPSRVAAATPIIIGANSIAPTTTPEVIIPKINVQIPVDYSETSTNEAAIENDLEDGVVHYPTTVMPGQLGNAAFFGHSSNNIFNSGKYKFAFVLLHTLVDGDTFYLTYHDKVYVYKVISKTVVPPTDVSVLGSVAGQTATATLITCDPPGTSINRLVVVGQQISPSPSSDTAGTTLAPPTSIGTSLPGNGPSLWSRAMSSIGGKTTAIIIVSALFILTMRWIIKKPRPDTSQASA